MNWLEALKTIPLPRLMLGAATLIVFLVAIENLPWAQSVIEHLLNMEGTPK